MISHNEEVRLADFSLTDDRLPILTSVRGSKITIITGGCLITSPYPPGSSDHINEFDNLGMWLFELDTPGISDDEWMCTVSEKILAALCQSSWLSLEYEHISTGSSGDLQKYHIFLSRHSIHDDQTLLNEQILIGLIALDQDGPERLRRWMGRANEVLLG